MGNRWSEEKIWKWYNERPWIRGCNYMSADCANRIDQWQEFGFEKRFETTESEFKLMQELGYNSIRIIPEFFVWQQEHDGFMERFERYIELAHKYGISCMVVLGNDCCPPKEETLKRLYLGEQKWDLGYHGGRKVSQHGTFDGPGYSVLDDEKTASEYYEFVRELVKTYKDDERIIIWNVFNEIGNSKRENMSLPYMKKFFEIIREIDPIQPLTVELWRNNGVPTNESEIYAVENSDIISFHSYGTYKEMIEIIATLKKYNRPIVCTEWLNRCGKCNIEEIFPLFFLEKIGSYHWALLWVNIKRTSLGIVYGMTMRKIRIWILILQNGSTICTDLITNRIILRKQS